MSVHPFLFVPDGLPAPVWSGEDTAFVYFLLAVTICYFKAASLFENGTFFHPLVPVARGGRRLQTDTVVQAILITFAKCE